ncbi:hypothetical protein [Segetibacter aerophilus]|uniref:Uncharacterized protein n=1 Tax=Segetibacter aerophilus TaxID=670293 RepID=A0A512B9R6_9BACT|nr:hypothetical protein [Segetibacter aerophilus]GEO08710.1 hypothetical protein SAE01_12060 [Segetibacter aerophilus]
MKLSKYTEVIDTYTGKASEISRQITLAGIGIVWLFKKTIGGSDVLDKRLIPALIFLGASALFDLLQYLIAGELWTSYYLKKRGEVIERLKTKPETEQDPDTPAPMGTSRTIQVFYRLKMFCMVVAYLLIIIYMVKNVSFQ